MNSNKYNIDNLTQKWFELEQKFYVCQSVIEVACHVVYELFNKDILNDIDAFYKYIDRYKYFKFIVNLENNIYFIFRIQWITGMFGDTGLKVSNPELKKTNDKIPNDYNDVWDLVENE